MEDSNQLQQELNRCFDKGYELKARTQALSDELVRLKGVVEVTEREMYEANAELQTVESRKANIMRSVFGAATRRGAPAPTTQRKDAANPVVATSNSLGSRIAGKRGAPDMICEAFSIVVLLNGSWCEIWCKDCGANASPFSGTFFTGISGLNQHVIRTHKNHYRSISVKDIMATCARRALSDEDVALIRQGKEPKVEIKKNFLVPAPVEEDASPLDELDVTGLIGGGADRDIAAGDGGLTESNAEESKKTLNGIEVIDLADSDDDEADGVPASAALLPDVRATKRTMSGTEDDQGQAALQHMAHVAKKRSLDIDHLSDHSEAEDIKYDEERQPC
ncbi:hypothetical protein LTR85_007496 [Meristemomyces frigidus]|nr:hypothetical protein LTR85_007496 [Meristemomyces frigidus]